MSSHFSLAVDGLTPNFKHYEFAVLGRRVSISIVPKKRKQHGAGGHSKKLESEYYEVTVSVVYNKRVWRQKKTFSKNSIKRMERVLASFKYIRSLADQVVMYIDLLKAKIINNEVSINIKQNNKD